MRTLQLIVLCCSAISAQQRHVVVISLDGYPAYALRDPHTPAPTLRGLIREGAWAPGGMTPVNPTVTWPNHTSMVTGVDASRHGVLFNGMPVRKDGTVRIDPWVTKLELVQAPTVYDLAHGRGMTTAEVDWVAIQDAPTIDFAFSEVPKSGSPIVRELVAAGIVSLDDINGFAKAPITYRDEIWTLSAIHILQKHHPNLLLFHLLTTDSAQHRYGARSLGALSALALADRQVERLIDAARSAGILADTTFLVVSDHGFHTAKRQIRPAALLKQRNITGVTIIPEGGTAMVYGSLPPETFRNIEGISQVITPDQFAGHGFPKAGGRMADLVLAAEDEYAFSGDTDGPVVSDLPPASNSGNHGYLISHPDMRPIFVAWGNGIKPGARLEGVRTIDLAPTIARLLGFEMKSISGTVIAAALTP
ncbi:MAG: alkaline phosphatase family protein [Bryobacteraceae bacterium]